MKILICDDHKIVRDGLRQILQQLEEVTFIGEARDGNEALTILKVDAFEVVLLDISLPDQNGLEVLKYIKSKWPSTNVLMLSMHPQEQYAIQSSEIRGFGVSHQRYRFRRTDIGYKKSISGRKIHLTITCRESCSSSG